MSRELNPNHGPRACGHPGCAKEHCRFANTEPAAVPTAIFPLAEKVEIVDFCEGEKK